MDKIENKRALLFFILAWWALGVGEGEFTIGAVRGVGGGHDDYISQLNSNNDLNIQHYLSDINDNDSDDINPYNE